MPDAGKVRIAPQVKIAYLPQKIVFENEERSCYDTMLYEANCLPQEAYDRLAMFGFRGEDIRTPVGALSGGERSRLKLCILMGSDINLLILDEPTNHLDIASREWIESALMDYDKTLLFVSHDRFFIQKFATRILSFNGDGSITDYRGTFDEYQKFIQMQPVYEKEKKSRLKEKAAKPPRPVKGAGNISKIEKEISKIENSIAALDEETAQYSSDYVKLMEIEEKKTELSARLDELYSEWEKLCE